MRGISKHFGSVHANTSIDLDIHPGKVHALLGENGAGKSTLMNILAGFVRPDAGQVEIDARPLPLADPRAAIDAGIGMVHQHFQLVPSLSITANVLLNDEPQSGLFIDEAAAHQQVAELCRRFGLAVDPRARVRDTTVATQQKVEILKVLRREARVLILDEPTAVLTPSEVRELFAFLVELRAHGTAIVLITHKLPEALGIADRLTVLRGGRVIATKDPTSLTTQDLARMMVGREVLLDVAKPSHEPGDVVFAAHALAARDDRGMQALQGVELEVRAGEIVGVAGVDGNGQTELVEVVAGLRPASSGTIEWLGETIEDLSVLGQMRRGIGYIPEDRRSRGLVLEMDLRANVILRRFREEPLSKGLQLDRGVIDRQTRTLLDRYGVTASPDTAAANLSGGNQQKIVVGRELLDAPRLLIASQPTRGVDIGATQFVYDQLVAARDRGAAILLVSFDLDELLALSDRLVVMYRGQINARFANTAVSQEELGAAMAGSVSGARA